MPSKNIRKIGPFNFDSKPIDQVISQASQSINDVLNQLSRDLASDPNAEIIFYFVGHGNKESLSFTEGTKESYKRKFVDFKFKDISCMMGQLFPTQNISMILDSCKSGSGIEICAPIAQSIITGSAADKDVWWYPMEHSGFTYYNYWVFSYHFFSALRGQYPDGRKIDADKNKDGTTSREEAFEYTKIQPLLGKDGPSAFIPVLWLELGSREASNPQYFKKNDAQCSTKNPLLRKKEEVLEEDLMKNNSHSKF